MNTIDRKSEIVEACAHQTMRFFTFVAAAAKSFQWNALG